jgi:E3 ubiquitin-protein ligase RNF19A
VHNQILPPLNIQEKFEEVKNTQQRLSLRYSKELPSVDEEKCEICLSTLVFPWSHPDCGLHVFCMECVYKYLEVLINDSKVLHIKCPGDTCEIEFSDFDVKSLVTQEIYSKYLKFKARAELLADQSIRWCIRPDCEGFVRGSSNDKLKACPVCDFKICFQCGKAGHPKKSCEDVIDEDYELWARGREIQLCPKCKHRIEKIDGCNHMSCAVCGYNWCWLCRGHYTSNHFNAFNPFGCPNLQSGYNTRQQWPMWKIYLTRCRGFCLWICIVIFLPLVLLFGPAFHVTKAYHNDNIYDRSICKNLLLESFIFICITIITPLGYACAVPFLVGYSVFKCIKYYCI